MYSGEPRPIELIFNRNPIDIYGYAYSDITSMYFGLKKKSSDLDDAYLSTDNIVIDEANHTFTVTLSQADTNDIQGAFKAVLGVSVADSPDMIEIELENNRVYIKSDYIRA